jgi:hypothetical protein
MPRRRTATTAPTITALVLAALVTFTLAVVSFDWTWLVLTSMASVAAGLASDLTSSSFWASARPPVIFT